MFFDDAKKIAAEVNAWPAWKKAGFEPLPTEPTPAFSTPMKRSRLGRILGLRMSDPPAPSKVVPPELVQAAPEPPKPFAYVPATAEERKAWLEAFAQHEEEQAYSSLLNARTSTKGIKNSLESCATLSSMRMSYWHDRDNPERNAEYDETDAKAEGLRRALRQWYARERDLKHQEPVDLAEGPSLELAS